MDRILKLDTRTGLLISVCVFIIVFFSTYEYTSEFCILATGILLAASGHPVTALKYLFYFLAAAVLLILHHFHGVSIPLIPPILLMSVYKLMPLFMSAAIIFANPFGELLAALNKLHVPQSIILSIAVMGRFAPTITTELKAIIDAMKIRGLISISQKVFLHPLRTFEYVLVPMVIRSLKIADELSASAVARGIECRRKRESYYEMKMKLCDYITIPIGLAITIYFILI